MLFYADFSTNKPWSALRIFILLWMSSIVQANILWFSIARQACANSQSTTSTSTTTAPVEARLPSSSPPPLLPGKNQVTVLSANCLAFGKDFKTSNTWSWPSTTSWTTLRITSRSRPWSCPSTSSLSGPTRGLQRLYGPGPSSTSSSGPTDGISARGCWSRSLYSGFRCDPVFFPQLWSVDTILVKLC